MDICQVYHHLLRPRIDRTCNSQYYNQNKIFETVQVRTWFSYIATTRSTKFYLTVTSWLVKGTASHFLYKFTNIITWFVRAFSGQALACGHVLWPACRMKTGACHTATLMNIISADCPTLRWTQVGTLNCLTNHTLLD